jgi:hypothetical protein
MLEFGPATFAPFGQKNAVLFCGIVTIQAISFREDTHARQGATADEKGARISKILTDFSLDPCRAPTGGLFICVQFSGQDR